MTRRRSILASAAVICHVTLYAILSSGAAMAGQVVPRSDDPDVVQVDIPAPAGEVRTRIIDGMEARGAALAEQSDQRLLFKAITAEHAGLAAVYGCKNCGEPYRAYLFMLIPTSETGTTVMGRHWVAIPQADGEDRRFRPQKNRELKDIAKMLNEIAAGAPKGR
jgi:hypothetical protein